MARFMSTAVKIAAGLIALRVAHATLSCSSTTSRDDDIIYDEEGDLEYESEYDSSDDDIKEEDEDCWSDDGGNRCGDEDDEERLERIADAVQGVTSTSYPCELIDSDEPNAFADGCRVMITRGAMELLNDDEVAFVVGHEIVHNLRNHPARSMQRNARIMETVVDLVRERDGVLAKVATGVAVGTAGLAITRLVDRGCEHLADGGGQAIASEAGFDGEAGARALDKLAHGRGGGLFATHPSTSSRVRNLQRG